MLDDVLDDALDDDLIAALRRRAAPLEPDAAGRARLAGAVTGHALRYLDGVPALPAFVAPAGGALLPDLGLPDRPRPVDDVLGVLARHVDAPGVTLTSGSYLGYIPAGGLFSAALGDLLAGVSNRYSALPAISPGAAAVEAACVRWLSGVVGYGPGAGGTLTSGGSIATITAVHAAREATGLDPAGAPDACVYVTDLTHHCVDKALRVCGLGAVRVRRVGLDDAWRLDPAALTRAVRADRAAGLRPWLVVATAGSTGVGAVDPLEAVADVCAAEDLWLHVDGAYGGLFALCPEGSPRLAGLARADTVVVDPHKALFLPYGTGAVLARDRGVLHRALAADADYLPEPTGAWDDVPAADLSLELTRPFRGLRLWLALQLAGVDAFAAALSEKVRLARYLHGRFAAETGFEVGPAPDLSLFVFRARPGRGVDADTVNLELARRVQAAGETFVSTTRVPSTSRSGTVMLRAAVLSFRTHREHVDAAFEAIVREAAGLRGVPRPRTTGETTGGSPPMTSRPTLTVEFAPARNVPAGSDFRVLEHAVLNRWYGDTPDLLEEEYGPYEDRTVFVGVRGQDGALAGFARLILPGRGSLKTIDDVAHEPWSVDGTAAAREAGIDLARTWDIATIGVDRAVLDSPAVAMALYHAIWNAGLANGAGWVVAVLDQNVRRLLAAQGISMPAIPGTGPESYMGSPACAPVWVDLRDLHRAQREAAPEAYRMIALGEGLNVVELPDDSVFRAIQS